ncbi:MAG: HEAT repeat domain-containing protein [Gemmatimonadetes bacterium]|nr:HEAT repeat domain-containing protein [Gemmatimonadota bacterium]
MTQVSIDKALGAVARTYNLARAYPLSHPGVINSAKEIAASLPALLADGPLQVEIRSSGFAREGIAILPRNQSLAELARTLFGRGVRGMVIHPGVQVEHLLAVFRVADGSSAPDAPSLGNVSLFTGRAPERLGAKAFSSRSTGIFTGATLPPEVEARRLLEHFAIGANPDHRPAVLTRYGELAPALLRLGDIRLIADIVAAVYRVSKDADPMDAAYGAAVINTLVDERTLVAIVHRLGSERIDPAEREGLTAAVAAVAPRAARVVIDAYLASPESRGTYRAAMRMAGERAIEALAVRLEGESEGVSTATVGLIGAVGPGSSAVLVRFLRHHSPVLRRSALLSLAEARPSDLSAMAAPLLRDPAPRVRAAAARAIAAAGDPAWLSLIRSYLDSEPDEEVIVEVINALGKLGAISEAGTGPAATGLVADYAAPEAKRPAKVRVAAARALSQNSSAIARKALQSLRADASPDVREIAIRATT